MARLCLQVLLLAAAAIILSPTLLIFVVAVLNVSSVTCVGTAFIENWCDLDVYVRSVANVTNNTVSHLDRNVGNFSEIYRVNPNSEGISLKIATAPNDSFITQFEYTYHPGNPRIYYGISNVSRYPFED